MTAPSKLLASPLPQRFAVLAWACVSTSILAFLVGPVRWIIFARGNGLPNASSLTLCVWLGWLWIALFALACVQSPRRSLWLLLGAPFALWWPAMWIFNSHACSLIGNCH
jgi:hypothetical protein